VDWNQSLPDVADFARSRDMQHMKLDWLALSDPSLIVPAAQPWDCQAASSADAGQLVVVAAVRILEEANCGWLERYPHQAIAHGGFYAFHLPNALPAAGAPGGPPLPKDRMPFFGMPFLDLRFFIIDLERHPETTKASVNHLFDQFKRMQTAKKQQ
jgi:hypothetical protein